MDEYKKPYLILFNAITDAIKMLEESRVADAIEILYTSQMKSEDAFICFKEQEKM